jgi:hypothetical protein
MMKYKIIVIGILSGLIGLFGCANHIKKSEKKKNSIQPTILNNVLFTTPTIENVLPEFEDKTDPTNLQIPEDEWRQIEFVSKNQKRFIDLEISKIKNIYENYSHKADTYIAFKDVAVRDLITQSLNISFQKIQSSLTNSDITIKGVSLFNNPGQVKNGFSFSANGIKYYGQYDSNNNVKWLCIYLDSSKENLRPSTEGLSMLLKTENLYLVAWIQMKVFDESSILTDLITDKK